MSEDNSINELGDRKVMGPRKLNLSNVQIPPVQDVVTEQPVTPQSSEAAYTPRGIIASSDVELDSGKATEFVDAYKIPDVDNHPSERPRGLQRFIPNFLRRK